MPRSGRAHAADRPQVAHAHVEERLAARALRQLVAGVAFHRLPHDRADGHPREGRRVRLRPPSALSGRHE
eukprot:38340-Prymnesium_polylepis.1